MFYFVGVDSYLHPGTATLDVLVVSPQSRHFLWVAYRDIFEIPVPALKFY